jgi:hypothetical protein
MIRLQNALPSILSSRPETHPQQLDSEEAFQDSTIRRGCYYAAESAAFEVGGAQYID